MKPYLTEKDYKHYEYVLSTNWNGLTTLDIDVIPRMFGFKDRWDYYEAGQMNTRLSKIKIPTFALQARDDWVCHEQYIPFEEVAKRGSNIILGMTEKGTHCCHIAGSFGKPYQFYPLPIMRFFDHFESTKKSNTKSKRK